MSLKEAIPPILTPSPPRRHFTYVFEKFHAMAIAYLYTKKRSGTLATHLVQLSIEDFALDCIAELFQQDEKQGFGRLVEYYGQYNMGQMDELDVESISRRLVFSEVSNRLFKFYGEADPNLHKLIRNLKDVKPTSRASVKTIGGKGWVCFGGKEVSASSLPLMPAELLEARIVPLLVSHRSMGDLLGRLAHKFLEQTIYRRAYPLIGFAQVLLSAFSRLVEHVSSEPPDLLSFREDDLRQLLTESVTLIKAEKHCTYVGKGKVEEGIYASYFEVVTEYLGNEYIAGIGNGECLFALLGKRIRGLTNETYQGNHRVYLEFLLKETRRVLLKTSRSEL